MAESGLIHRLCHARRFSGRCLGWILLIGATWAPASCSSGGTETSTQRIQIGHRSFVLELALDDPTRFEGLSDRDAIADDGGMLFVFPISRKQAMVMRRCLVPIDVIFLDPNGRIVSMHRMEVEPPDRPESQLQRYSSQWPAQFAIELKGSTIDQLELKLGDRVELPVEVLKRRSR